MLNRREFIKLAVCGRVGVKDLSANKKALDTKIAV
jgi:hypothetical protein